MNKPKVVREGFVTDEPFDVEIEETKPASPMAAAEPETETPSPTVAEEFKWPFVYKLRYRPLRVSVHESLDELTFREPNAGDILDFGNPCNIEVKQSGKQFIFNINIDDNKMMVVLGNLCTNKNVMEQHLRRLDIRDFSNIANKLRRFFRPDWEMVNW